MLDSDRIRPEPPLYIVEGNAVQSPPRRADDAPVGLLGVGLIVAAAVAIGLLLTCLVCALVEGWR
jgi:hypothetical protein